ncbi:hypothetical protein [Burkholderia contaminans]|uniref:hypothetical protein n=1 Tax=Burkholderia contaminans TaxID=488447 RepID=UPI00158288CB|nr:hypothetical protein [Burkholderia contaminans]
MLPHETRCPMTRRVGMHRKVGGGDVVARYTPVEGDAGPDIAGIAIRLSVRNPLASMHAGGAAASAQGQGRVANGMQSGWEWSAVQLGFFRAMAVARHSAKERMARMAPEDDRRTALCGRVRSGIRSGARSLGECKQDRRHPRVAVADDVIGL